MQDLEANKKYLLNTKVVLSSVAAARSAPLLKMLQNPFYSLNED